MNCMDESAMEEKVAEKFPPRAWTYKYMRDGWEENRIEEKFFRHNYPGNLIEYLSLAEHQSAMDALRVRVSDLEQRIEFMLDDGYCDLYRKQAAEAIGYTASMQPMEYPHDEISRLRALLGKCEYGLRHSIYCPVRVNYELKCNCGFDELEAKLRAEREQKG